MADGDIMELFNDPGDHLGRQKVQVHSFVDLYIIWDHKGWGLLAIEFDSPQTAMEAGFRVRPRAHRGISEVVLAKNI